MPVERHPLTDVVIGGAIAVHRSLGAGLFESVYERCMCEELDLARVRFERQVPLPLKYKRVNFPIAFRVDLIVEDWLIVELKAVNVCCQFTRHRCSPTCGCRAQSRHC
jgi:GxxExxY protein